ncbi:unnamed protein product [Soboliphyme baturini]|uniref:GtrA domain-containing protein n=1 Tax=Soboliphyme baturini TaxID=241478 RepID=A0A183IVI2_9BILA|nr:unnamed protein product [Soboliphyme baturini]
MPWVVLNFTVSEPIFTFYQNQDKAKLIEEYNGKGILDVFRKWSSWKSMQLYPFRKTFLGIDTLLAYGIYVEDSTVDFRLVVLFVGGLLLFFAAKWLSRTAVTYYISGSLLSIVGSLLVLVFIIFRSLPKKSTSLAFLFGGWSLVLFILSRVWQNLLSVFQMHTTWIAAYAVSLFLKRVSFTNYFSQP